MATEANDNLFFDSFQSFAETPTEVINTADREVIPNNTMLLKFTINGTEFKKTVNSDELINDEGIDTNLISTTTRLIDKTYVEAISKHDSHMKRRLNALSLRSAFAGNGMVLLPNMLVGHALKMIELYEKERGRLVNDLIDNWDRAVREVEMRNPSVFKQSDYPSKEAIRSKFSISYRLLSVSVPDKLKDIDPKLHAKLVEEDRARVQEDMAQIRGALRVGFVEIVETMLDKIRGIGRGERKTFKSGYVETVRDFLATFPAKDLTNDTEMREAVTKAQQLLSGVSPDAIRNNLETKVAIERGLSEITSSISNWVEVKARPVKL